MLGKSEALLLVDLQNDFCFGGALAVPQGDEVISVANSLAPKFQHVIATMDWHPGDHASFAVHHDERAVGDVVDLDGVTQVLWPVHCVQDSKGAAFHPELNQHFITKIIKKGEHTRLDSYSAFLDNDHCHATELDAYLKQQDIKSLYIMGLATDYCVKFTVLDALKHGYQVCLVNDGCRGVGLKPEDVNNAVKEMLEAGADIMDSDQIS